MEQGPHYSASLMVWSRLFPLSHLFCLCVCHWNIHLSLYSHDMTFDLLSRFNSVYSVHYFLCMFNQVFFFLFFFTEKLNLMPRCNIQNNNICHILYNWKLRPNMQKKSLLPLIIGSNLCMPQGKESQIMNWTVESWDAVQYALYWWWTCTRSSFM